MAEDYTLTDPIVPAPGPSTVGYKVSAMVLDLEVVVPAAPALEPGLVSIKLKDNTGAYLFCEYLGAAAVSLIRWMNTANFSSTSMQKRVLQKLAVDGKLPPGTVTGTPDPALELEEG